MSAAVEKTRRRPDFSDGDRIRMVRTTFVGRPEGTTVQQIADELGVSVALLYHWRKRFPEATESKRGPSTKMTTVPRTKAAPAHEIVISPSQERPADALDTESEADELVRLRAENARLKAALVAGLELHDERR